MGFIFWWNEHPASATCIFIVAKQFYQYGVTQYWSKTSREAGLLLYRRVPWICQWKSGNEEGWWIMLGGRFSSSGGHRILTPFHLPIILAKCRLVPAILLSHVQADSPPPSTLCHGGLPFCWPLSFEELLEMAWSGIICSPIHCNFPFGDANMAPAQGSFDLLKSLWHKGVFVPLPWCKPLLAWTQTFPRDLVSTSLNGSWTADWSRKTGKDLSHTTASEIAPFLVLIHALPYSAHSYLPPPFMDLTVSANHSHSFDPTDYALCLFGKSGSKQPLAETEEAISCLTVATLVFPGKCEVVATIVPGCWWSGHFCQWPALVIMSYYW